MLDGRIWFRNFQIVPANVGDAKSPADAEPEMVEIGPRFVLNPIRMFDGSFGGMTLYENPNYISPNTLRAQKKVPAS